MDILIDDLHKSSDLIGKQAKTTQFIMETDPLHTVLTGRTPEIICNETGISQEEMFDKTKKIIYVGDPWQRMGKKIDSPNMVLVDYEFGDTASFITNEQSYRKMLTDRYGKLLTKISGELDNNSDLSEKDSVWLRSFKREIEEAYTSTQNTKDLKEYHSVAAKWKKALALVNESFEKDEIEESEKSSLGYLRKDAWFDCVYAARGLDDTADYFEIILPKLELKKKELQSKGIEEEQLAEELEGWKQIFIREIRNFKKTKQSEVVQAVFPQLPFANQSFDTFIASWSISAHSFEEMSYDGFMTCWEEIIRVLKVGGNAYIFPLNEMYDERGFYRSLADVKERFGMEWVFINNEGVVVKDYEDGYTLQLMNLGLPDSDEAKME